MVKIKLLTIFLIAVIAAGCASTGGAPNDGVHKVVIQVSTDDPRTQTIALNNAVNLQKALGPGNIKVEVVAYGPGLTLLTRNGRQSKRVQDLVMYDEFRFSACGNTMDTIKRKQGKLPLLVDGIQVVQAGVQHIMELQEQGYAYIRP
jgi:intracellular sulfur oxidation DsrE/DsrF family protein